MQFILVYVIFPNKSIVQALNLKENVANHPKYHPNCDGRVEKLSSVSFWPLLGVFVVLASFWTVVAQAQLPAAPAAPRFDIQRFIIEGNTLIPKAEAEALVAPFVGGNRDFGDVQRALEALQQAYVERGYNATRVLIPEQDLVAGQVRLEVIEARIRNVRVEGNKFFDSANVRTSLPSVREGEAPNRRRIGENFQLANENPAKQARVVLETADEPGRVDAVVRVTDSNPVRHSVFLDNTGRSSTGQLRAGYGFQHANMANRDQVLTAQVITSPTYVSKVTIIGAGYRVPIYGLKGIVDVFAGYSDVNSGTVQDLFTVSGSGTILGVRYTQILPRLDAYEQRLALGWDYRDFHNQVNVVGTAAGIVPDVTIKPLSLTYSGRYSQVGRDLSMFAGYSYNLPGGGDGGQEAFERTRAGARARYGITRVGAAYTQGLPRDLLVRGVVNAQYTTNALVPGEQFGMGGMDNVRGYFEREAASDIGHRATLEAYTPDWGQHLGTDWKARMLMFYEWARGRDNSPQRNGEVALSSFGLGLRMNQGKALSIRLDWAFVQNSAGTRQEGQDRLHFSLGYGF